MAYFGNAIYFQQSVDCLLVGICLILKFLFPSILRTQCYIALQTILENSDRFHYLSGITHCCWSTRSWWLSSNYQKSGQSSCYRSMTCINEQEVPLYCTQLCNIHQLEWYLSSYLNGIFLKTRVYVLIRPVPQMNPIIQLAQMELCIHQTSPNSPLGFH